jgi:hypothetical protein
MKLRAIPYLYAAFALLCIVPACDGYGSRLSLLGGASKRESPDPELERLRRMEMVRVLDFLDPDHPGTILETPKTSEVLPEDVAARIARVCDNETSGRADGLAFSTFPPIQTSPPTDASMPSAKQPSSYARPNGCSTQLVCERHPSESATTSPMSKGASPRMRVIMQNRNTGEIVTRDIPLELHHNTLPQRIGSSQANEAWNLEIVNRWAHEAMDPYRHAGWNLIKLLNGPNSF